MLARIGRALGCGKSDASKDAGDETCRQQHHHASGPAQPLAPPSPSKLPLASGSLRAFQAPRNMEEALAALHALHPSCPPSPECVGSLGGSTTAASDDICRAFAAGQHRRSVTPAHRQRERERVAQEQQEHLDTVDQLTRDLEVEGGYVVNEPHLDAMAVSGALHAGQQDPPQQQPFKLGRMFQTQAGSGTATGQLAPLHAIQLAEQAQAAAEATTAAPAAAASPVAAAVLARQASLSASMGGSLGSAIANCGSLWAPTSASISAIGPEASPAALEMAALGAAEASDRPSLQDGSVVTPASLLWGDGQAELSPGLAAFDFEAQRIEEGRSGGGEASRIPGTLPMPAQSPPALEASSQLHMDRSRQQLSLHAFGSQQALLPPQPQAGLTIPAAHRTSGALKSGSSSSSSSRRRLGSWRHVLHNLRPTCGGAAGKDQEQGGVRWIGRQRQVALAETAEDVRPKPALHRAARAPAASHSSGDENQPMIR